MLLESSFYHRYFNSFYLHNKLIEEQLEQNEELEVLIYELYLELENETKAFN
ncbi:Uncharacterised protein [Psychrobacter phenylpyruvicus]|uniref:Uncharacterized protein n=1 Tax=Psychrobacter phenylpyruvicus TaxID=29432 RepID=A0A379LLL0_9GAMM|nr:Uncharacterised protein [Psychrobacter phenylpyruvicus]